MDIFEQKELLTSLFGYITTPATLWTVFGVAVGVTAMVSYILYYHWRHYGVNRRLIRQVQTVYFAGVIILTLGSFISLISFLVI